MQPDHGETDRLSKPCQKIVRLKRRAEFLRVGKGRRWHCGALTIQAAARPIGEEADESRFGITLTKKVGNSVVRNRARRRLREALRLGSGDFCAKRGHDYVLVGRIDAVRLPFTALRAEIARGLDAVHRTGKTPGGRRPDLTKTATSAGRAAPERIRPGP